MANPVPSPYSLNDLRAAIEIASRSVRIVIAIAIVVILISFGVMEGLYQMLPHSPGIPPSVRHVTCFIMAAVITCYGSWSILLDAHRDLADLRHELRTRGCVERVIDEAR